MNEVTIATEKAVRFLAASLKTEKEVRQKLEKCGFDESVIDKVIEHLKSISYINDKEYVSAYMMQENKMKKYSIYEITSKLKLKGVSDELTNYVQESLESSGYESEIIEKIIDKKRVLGEDEYKIKAYLYRRGFKGGL